MNKLRRSHWIALGIVVYLIVGAALVQILSGYLFFALNKKIPTAFQFDLFIQSWRYYAVDHQQFKRLVLALIASCAVVFVLPVIAIAALLNKPRELHGSARFANHRDIAKANLTSDKGIILGKRGGKYLIQGGQTFVLLAAPTRSGKGVAVVIPNLLNWPDSLICLDMKYENFLYTSGFRQRCGQQVFLFAPFSETGETHRWNPLGFIRRGSVFVVDDINTVAFDLWPDTGDAKTDFWNNLARDLFLGVAGYVEQTPELTFSLGEIMRQGAGNGKDVKDHFKDIIESRAASNSPLPKYCTDALERFIAAADSGNTGGSIRATFADPLSIFASPMVEMATSACDFDIADVRRKRMTVYLGVPANKLGQAGRLMNMFFAQVLNLNSKELPQSDPTLKYQCLLLADEFTALGKIGMLSKAIGYMAGYGLRMLPIVQSVAQIRSVYKDETDNFVTNHETQIMYAPRELKDSNEFSETLGFFTEKARSSNRSRPMGLAAKGGGSSGENTSDQKRALMMPQELRELGDNKEILLVRGVKPILCDKCFFYNDSVFVDRLKMVSPSLKVLGKRLPTQKQLEHAAFVARDLCINVPKHDIGASTLFSANPINREIRTVALNEIGGTMSEQTLASVSIKLPPLDDPDSPSKESLDNLVDSFFSQLSWSPDESEPSPEAAVAGEGTKEMPIDLSLLDA